MALIRATSAMYQSSRRVTIFVSINERNKEKEKYSESKFSGSSHNLIKRVLTIPSHVSYQIFEREKENS